MPILACVIGEEFAAVLAAAQDGSEAAFCVLWRDVNPALLRYLRVAASGPAGVAGCVGRALGCGGGAPSVS